MAWIIAWSGKSSAKPSANDAAWCLHDLLGICAESIPARLPEYRWGEEGGGAILWQTEETRNQRRTGERHRHSERGEALPKTHMLATSESVKLAVLANEFISCMMLHSNLHERNFLCVRHEQLPHPREEIMATAVAEVCDLRSVRSTCYCTVRAFI